MGSVSCPRTDQDMQQCVVSSETSRVGGKHVGFGRDAQDKHLDASASAIPVLMHCVPCPVGKEVGVTAAELVFLGA